VYFAGAMRGRGTPLDEISGTDKYGVRKLVSHRLGKKRLLGPEESNFSKRAWRKLLASCCRGRRIQIDNRNARKANNGEFDSDQHHHHLTHRQEKTEPKGWRRVNCGSGGGQKGKGTLPMPRTIHSRNHFGE